MAHDNIEIEVKFPLYNIKEIISFLNKNAQRKTENVTQTDTYFTPAHKDFLSKKYPYQWLRLRESNKGVILNYKHFYPENQKETDYCNEFETEVNENIKQIFQRLDFKELVKVEKIRSTWQLKNVEVAIDEIKELGSFIELEITSNVENPKEAKAYLYKILQEMCAQIGEEDYRGYPFLLLEKRGYKLFSD